MNDSLFPQLQDLPYFRALVRAVEASFYQNLPLPAPTLDIGCGDGHFTQMSFDHPIDVGLDPWAGPIHEALRRSCYRLLVQADGGRAPFDRETFASAISNSVLEHIPHIDQVLGDVARCLKPGAPFYFCVPNERYLSELSISRILGRGYTEWFRRISRVEHAEGPQRWQERLERSGFQLERWWHYFSPAALHALEWGHYFGFPSLVARRLTGRWILVRSRWNLFLTEKYVRRFASTEPQPDGVFTFYQARKA
jgi:SAM-dependent methyltransferase